MTPASTVAGERRRLRTFVQHEVERLQTGYLNGSSRSRADISHLRRAIAKPLGSDPAILRLVLDPEAPPSTFNEPTRGENATLGALTLYALHQQSRSRPMHKSGVSFGEALSLIRQDGGNERQGVIRRFDQVMTASTLTEVLRKARGLVQLLKQADQPLDYSQFADDLYRLQNPYSVDQVRLKWGRAFYRTPSTITSHDEETSK